jgi:hypothetical protein
VSEVPEKGESEEESFMLRKAILALILIGSMVGLSASSRAQSSDEEVRGLLKAMNVEGQYKQMQTILVQQLKPSLEGIAKNLPEESRARFTEVMNKLLAQLPMVDTRELMDATTKVYAKHYTAEEIKALKDFYGTPLGQKLLTATPQITNELMSTTMQWNQTQANKLLQDLLDQFPELNTALGGAPPAGEHQHQ